MRETSRLIGGPREVKEDLAKMLDHRVVIGRIVRGDAEDLRYR